MVALNEHSLCLKPKLLPELCQCWFLLLGWKTWIVLSPQPYLLLIIVPKCSHAENSTSRPLRSPSSIVVCDIIALTEGHLCWCMITLPIPLSVLGEWSPLCLFVSSGYSMFTQARWHFMHLIRSMDGESKRQIHTHLSYHNSPVHIQ